MRADAVVVGGGPAGAAAAAALSRGGLSVVLLEREARAAWRIGESLPSEAGPLLRSLGVWDGFQGQGHLRAYESRSAWGGDTLSARDALSNPFGPSWILDREAFDLLLLQAARAAGARIMRGAQVAGATLERGQWTVLATTAEGPASFEARAVVDATGRSARVALSAGGRRLAVDRLVCAYARCRPGRAGDIDLTTLVESSADGWWYTARLPSSERLFAWFTDGDLWKQSTAKTPDAFPARLRATRFVGAVFSEYYSTVDAPVTTPAFTARLATVAGDRLIAVGDAALSVDPLSARGLLFALRSGIRGAAALADALAGNSDATRDYCDWVDSTWQEYLRTRARVYAAERRWSDRPFWKRRSP